MCDEINFNTPEWKKGLLMETNVIRKHLKRLKSNGDEVKLIVNLTYRAKFGGTDGKP